jgi:hypothetical protein
MLETNEKEIFKALVLYKERYKTIASIDMRQLENILKEIKNGSNTTTQQPPRTRRPSDR